MELIKGKIYMDTPEQTETSTYLRFVGYDKKVRSADFELVKGVSFYLSDYGIIPFPEDDIFYEPTPEELENL